MPIHDSPRLPAKCTGMRRVLGIAGILCLATIAGAALAACGSSGSSSASSAQTSASDPTQQLSITIADPNPATNTAPTWYAYAKGIWKQLNLNVTIVPGQGAQVPVNIAAGRLLLGNYGTTAAFPPTAAGHVTNVIFGLNTGSEDGALFASTNGSVKTWQDLSGQKIGVVGAGGSSYGAATSWSVYLTSHGLQPAHIVVEPNASVLIAALVSGQIAASVDPPTIFESAITAGKVKEVVAASSALAKSVVGTEEVGNAYFGLKSLLAQNQAAITRFIAGERIALAMVQKLSDAQVAAVLATTSPFAPSVVPSQTLVGDVGLARPFWGIDNGYISASAWSQSLQSFKTWGLATLGQPISLSSPEYSYANMVNMSYWEAATPIVNNNYKKYGQ
jgi:ABC-type nitrate/sulfonate/bicarbonate transport system substrate-binding protein